MIQAGQSDSNFSKPYSEETAKVIDMEISTLKCAAERYYLEENKDKS
jgi:cell division protease FtsH